MPFSVSDKTLERLEWPDIVARLCAHARTPQGHSRAEGALFEDAPSAVRDRLAETSEARALLDAEELPPLGGVHALGDALARLARGGTLDAPTLLGLRSSLEAMHGTARFLLARSSAAPALAGTAEVIADHGDLEREIARCIDTDGTVRDNASSVLAEARREVRSLSGEAQKRIERSLRDPDVAAALSDGFFTVRGDRYVLPVRTDARSRVPGIVHDASSSGTTLFVEPQALVDLNNRLKEAELTVERETQRVLRHLSDRAAAQRESIGASLLALGELDFAFARGHLSREWDAVEPRVLDAGELDLKLLRHPLLGAECVPNDMQVGGASQVLVISGPNAGGKTVAMKALALAALCTRAGLHVAAEAGARVDLMDAVLADIGDEQDLRQSLSTFSAHMANLSQIVARADRHALVALDEVGVGTDPSEGAALAQAVLEVLAERGARVVTTTHYNLLKEMAEVDARFANASVEFDPESLAPSYRLTLGTAGSSSATAVAARMGMPAAVLERANALLEREDRRLDQMLTELSTSRGALARERSEAQRLRAEGEATRREYGEKLERLQARRDKLFEQMRAELDVAFRSAHREVADVIRDLQRGGSARDAALARERLLGLETRAIEVAEAAPKPPAPPRTPTDWSHAQPGDEVEMPGGRKGALVALPDRHGKVTVTVGTARMTLPAEQVVLRARRRTDAPEAARGHVRIETAPPTADAGQCDLRGMRVDEALDRLLAALDSAASAGRNQVLVVHGLGTGKLRAAVREHLAASPYVLRAEAPPGRKGGEGATLAVLKE